MDFGNMFHLSHRVSGDLLTGAILLGFLLFYSGYDKHTKQVEPRKLVELFSGKQHWQTVLRELNRVVGLSSLTLISLALMTMYCPDGQCDPNSGTWARVLQDGAMLARIHSAYSAFEFFQNWAHTGTIFSMLLGVASFVALDFLDPFWFVTAIAPSISNWGEANYAAAALIVLGLAAAHTISQHVSTVTTIEKTESGNRLGLRPFGFVALVAAGAAACSVLYTQTSGHAAH